MNMKSVMWKIYKRKKGHGCRVERRRRKKEKLIVVKDTGKWEEIVVREKKEREIE